MPIEANRVVADHLNHPLEEVAVHLGLQVQSMHLLREDVLARGGSVTKRRCSRRLAPGLFTEGLTSSLVRFVGVLGAGLVSIGSVASEGPAPLPVDGY